MNQGRPLPFLTFPDARSLIFLAITRDIDHVCCLGRRHHVDFEDAYGLTDEHPLHVPVSSTTTACTRGVPEAAQDGTHPQVWTNADSGDSPSRRVSSTRLRTSSGAHGFPSRAKRTTAVHVLHDESDSDTGRQAIEASKDGGSDDPRRSIIPASPALQRARKPYRGLELSKAVTKDTFRGVRRTGRSRERRPRVQEARRDDEGSHDDGREV